MDPKLEQAVNETIAAVQAIADKNATAEKKTAAQIAELFGQPVDTAQQFAALRIVVLQLAGRVAALETAKE